MTNETTTTEPTFQRDALQEEAIEKCCSTDFRIACVTGQAGTGKTSIMKRVYHAFKDAGHSVALAAPTGKAAKRIAEATGIPATTLHKLLEYTHPGDPDPKTGKVTGISVPRRTQYLRLDQDVILVDEYSMVNEEVNRALLDAVPTGGLVRCFGDVNQLPPIEGNGFDDGPKKDSSFQRHLKQFAHASVMLKNIYRQGEGSGIVKNGHRILNGMCPQPADDFRITTTLNHAFAVLDYVKNSKIDFASLDNQIITPLNISAIGTVKLNSIVQDLLMKDKLHEAKIMPRTAWDAKKNKSLMLVPGDKVIWMKNDYNLEIFNGETGIVESLEHDLVTINFGDRTIAVPPWVEYEDPTGKIKGYDPRTQLDLAYVVTTHKSQGCEYDNVVYLMSNSAFRLLSRANFYTAITRARKHVHVITDARSFQSAVVR